jgi:hypothetical protein
MSQKGLAQSHAAHIVGSIYNKGRFMGQAVFFLAQFRRHHVRLNHSLKSI